MSRKDTHRGKRKERGKRAVSKRVLCILCMAGSLFLLLGLIFSLKTKKTEGILRVPYGTFMNAGEIRSGCRTVLSVVPEDGAYLLVSGDGIYFDEPGTYALCLEDGAGNLLEANVLVRDGEAPYIKAVTQSVEIGRIYAAEDLVLGGDKIDPAPRTLLSCDDKGVVILSEGRRVVFQQEGDYTFKAVLEDASGNRFAKNVVIQTRYGAQHVKCLQKLNS